MTCLRGCPDQATSGPQPEAEGKFNFHYWGGTASPPAHSVLIIVHRVDGETRARFLSCDTAVGQLALQRG